jgi:hypothetical protein
MRYWFSWAADRMAFACADRHTKEEFIAFLKSIDWPNAFLYVEYREV